MAQIFDEFPDRESILRFSAEDLAARLLLDLQGDSLNRHNFLLTVNRQYGNDEAVARAFLKAWSLLVGSGHLVEKAEPGWFFVPDEAEHEKRRIRLIGVPVPTAKRLIGDRWLISRELSSGGQGVTSIVTDERADDGSFYVLKELRKGGDEQARKRFANEAKVLSGIKHPNILKVVAFDVDADSPWYVSEYCAGGGLDRADLGSMNIRLRLDIFLDVCRALAAAHHSGVTHRDLKPENVLLRSPLGPAVLGDFGICWLVESNGERLTKANEDIGSSFCRAPELFDGPLDTVSPRADVYCLGKLLYWLLVGKGGRAGRMAREDFDRGNKNLVEIFRDSKYEHFNAVLRHMITEDPLVRYSNAEEVVRAMEHPIELFMGGFQTIDRAPSRCGYCGQGAYQRNEERTSLGEALLRRWRMYSCDKCGHMLLFEKTEQNDSW